MKVLFKVCFLSLSLLVACAASAWAYPVSVNDTITMLNGDTAAQYEGHYQFTTSSGGKYGTFCLELNEYFSPGSHYRVGSIASYAERGGLGGQEPAGSYHDPISGATKWLFGNFLSKNIYGATGYAENDYSLQLAFWMLEGELVAGKADSYITQYNADLAAKAYVATAKLNDTAGSAYDVMAMNLLDSNGNLAQSELVGTAPVPEPSTFFLLGIGLGGFALWRRKTRG